MIYKNKKGNFLFNILLIVLSLVVFFMLAPAFSSVINGVKYLAPNSINKFLLEAMVFGILIGIVRETFIVGGQR